MLIYAIVVNLCNTATVITLPIVQNAYCLLHLRVSHCSHAVYSGLIVKSTQYILSTLTVVLVSSQILICTLDIALKFELKVKLKKR